VNIPNLQSVVAETARFQGGFSRLQSIGGGLALQLAALQRDDTELNLKLIAAFQAGQDVRPLLRETREHLLQRAETHAAWAVNSNEAAALCRQLAQAFENFSGQQTK
jgi:hypothetical protein